MRLTIQCPECSHDFILDSAYMGMMRKCPECDHKFEINDDVISESVESPLAAQPSPEATLVMEKRSEDGASAESAAPKERLPAVQVACTGCFRNYPVRATDETVHTCQFCSATYTVAVGKRFLETHAEAQDASWQTLLSGSTHDSLDELLPTFGLEEEAVKEVKRRAIRDLPFARFQIRSSGSGAAVAAPQNCDICSKHLSEDEQAIAFDAEWTKSYEEMDKDMLNLASNALGGATTYTETTYTRAAIYCLCGTCRDSFIGKGFWIFRFTTYKGYPATQDWALAKFKKRPAQKLLG